MDGQKKKKWVAIEKQVEVGADSALWGRRWVVHGLVSDKIVVLVSTMRVASGDIMIRARERCCMGL
jgi:hypothetical protein